jgi:hypothetical protein
MMNRRSEVIMLLTHPAVTVADVPAAKEAPVATPPADAAPSGQTLSEEELFSVCVLTFSLH